MSDLMNISEEDKADSWVLTWLKKQTKTKQKACKAGYRGEGSRNKPSNFWGALQQFGRHKDRTNVAENYSHYNAEALQNKVQVPTSGE